MPSFLQWSWAGFRPAAGRWLAQLIWRQHPVWPTVAEREAQGRGGARGERGAREHVAGHTHPRVLHCSTALFNNKEKTPIHALYVPVCAWESIKRFLSYTQAEFLLGTVHRTYWNSNRMHSCILKIAIQVVQTSSLMHYCGKLAPKVQMGK